MPRRTDFAKALRSLARALARAKIPYMLVGGLAMAAHGRGRATFDIDVTVDLGPSDLHRLLAALGPGFRLRAGNRIGDFAETGVLPLVGPGNADIDILFGDAVFDRFAMRRTTRRMVHGVPVRVCAVEDLVTLKLIAARERDFGDIESLMSPPAIPLDLALLDSRARTIAATLGRPEIARRWRSIARSARLRRKG